MNPENNNGRWLFVCCNKEEAEVIKSLTGGKVDVYIDNKLNSDKLRQAEMIEKEGE